MSVVACRVYEDRYEIASDSITVTGWTQSKGNNTDACKLLENEDLIIGFSGLSSEFELMRVFVKSHKPSNESKEAVLDFMNEFGTWMRKKTDGDHTCVDGAYIIGLKNKVYAFIYWNIEEIIDYYAVGAGRDFAMSALYLGHDVERSCDVATELSICEKPIIKKVRKVANDS
jgi:ATP-dependent protease HslVU (ClpYQ) peptidase subunit